MAQNLQVSCKHNRFIPCPRYRNSTAESTSKQRLGTGLKSEKAKLPQGQPFGSVVYVQDYQQQCCYLSLVDPSSLQQLNCRRCSHSPSTQEEGELL